MKSQKKPCSAHGDQDVLTVKTEGVVTHTLLKCGCTLEAELSFAIGDAVLHEETLYRVVDFADYGSVLLANRDSTINACSTQVTFVAKDTLSQPESDYDPMADLRKRAADKIKDKRRRDDMWRNSPPRYDTYYDRGKFHFERTPPKPDPDSISTAALIQQEVRDLREEKQDDDFVEPRTQHSRRRAVQTPKRKSRDEIMPEPVKGRIRKRQGNW